MKAFLVLIVLAFSVHAEKSYQISANAPEQTKHYAPLLGEWTITDSSLDKEGNWQQGRGADWNWYTILDGHAIQDDWISPSLSVEVEEGKEGLAPISEFTTQQINDGIKSGSLQIAESLITSRQHLLMEKL